MRRDGYTAAEDADPAWLSEDQEYQRDTSRLSALLGQNGGTIFAMYCLMRAALIVAVQPSDFGVSGEVRMASVIGAWYTLGVSWELCSK